MGQPSGFETVNSRSYGTFTSIDGTTRDRRSSSFRLTDDINNNSGVSGAVIITDGNGGFATIHDFGDLHEFNVAFDSIGNSRVERSRAVDVSYVTWLNDQSAEIKAAKKRMAAVRAARALRDPATLDKLGRGTLDNGPAGLESMAADDDESIPDESLLVKPEGWALVIGVRSIQSDDDAETVVNGSILGNSRWDTYAANDVAGPQAGLAWCRDYGPWSVRLQGTALAGYNFGNIRQNGAIGSTTIPGALNRPLYAQPIYIGHYQPASPFTPSGELVAETTWQLTDGMILRLYWSGVVVENMLFTDDRVDYRLPDLGLREPGNQRLFVQNIFCGLEYGY